MAIIKTHFFNISFEHKDLMKMLIKMTEYQDEMFPQDSKKIANIFIKISDSKNYKYHLFNYFASTKPISKVIVPL